MGSGAGALTLSSPGGSVTTLHTRAGDWQAPGAALSGLQILEGELRVPEGIGGGTLTSAPIAVAGFDELIPSWNSRTGSEGRLSVEVQAQTRQGWTPWYSFGTWSAAEGRSSVKGGGDAQGQVLTDTLRLKAQASAFRYRLTLTGPGSAVRLLAFNTSDRASRAGRPGAPSDRAAWGRLSEVAPRSQMLYPGGGEAWCSPTSVSMILMRYGTDVPVPAAARGTYDQAYGGTGNWAFNTAYAAEQNPALQAFVTRLPSLSAAERYTAAGVPLAVSLGWKRAELAGAPLPSSDGHLMVLLGFDAQGNPVLNDPAGPSDAEVRRTYPRAAFERLWLAHSGGLTYVIAPKGTVIP